MVRSFRWITGGMLLLVATSCTDQEPIGPDGRPQFDEVPSPDPIIPDLYIIMFEDSVVNVRNTAARLTEGLVETEIGLQFERLKGIAAYIPPSELDQITGDGSVRKVYPNAVLDAIVAEPPADGFVSTLLSMTAGVQEDAPWTLDRIDQRELPLDGKFNYPGTGAGVYIYMIGNEVRTTHKEFGGRASLGLDLNGQCPGQFRDTGYAGTMIGETVGVAKAANLVTVRIGNGCGVGAATLDQFLYGVDWILGERAANPNRPMLMLTPFACPLDMEYVDAMEEAYLALIDARVPVVAGNGGFNGTRACTRSPQRLSPIITVGSTNIDDELIAESAWGECVDILVPGTNFPTTSLSSDTEIPTTTWTAYAAGYVAGAVALLLEKNPTATPEQVKQWLLDTSTKDVLSIHSSRPGTPNRLLFIESIPDLSLIAVDLLLRGEDAGTPLNLRSRGQLQVTVLGSVALVPSDVVLSSVRLGNGDGAEVGASVRPNGTYWNEISDVNGDGILDLTVRFDIPALVLAGALTSATAELVLTGETVDGNPIRGETPVRIVP